MSSSPARWCCVRSRERQFAWMLHTRSRAWKNGSPIWAPCRCTNAGMLSAEVFVGSLLVGGHEVGVLLLRVEQGAAICMDAAHPLQGLE